MDTGDLYLKKYPILYNLLMETNQKRRHNTLRMNDFDYAQSGAYFVTIVCHNRENRFGEIRDGEMVYSHAGMIALREWKALSTKFPYIGLDAFVIMPNHVHGIVVFYGDLYTTVGEKHSEILQAENKSHVSECFSPTPDGTMPKSLGSVIQNYKSISNRMINRFFETPGISIWQRNFYDHIIRNDEELEKIREYIYNNPSHWNEDVENKSYKK